MRPKRCADGDDLLVWRAVAVARATRVHPKFKKGASVRAAIAMVAIAGQLVAAGMERDAALRRAAVAALTTRTELRDELGADFQSTLDEILQGIEDLDGERLRAAAEDGIRAEADPQA